MVVPAGLLTQMTNRSLPEGSHPADTQLWAARARAIVMEEERQLGFAPVDREVEKLGYDIESRDSRSAYVFSKSKVGPRCVDDHSHQERNSLLAQ